MNELDEIKESNKWYRDNITAIHQLAVRGEKRAQSIAFYLGCSTFLNFILAITLAVGVN